MGGRHRLYSFPAAPTVWALTVKWLLLWPKRTDILRRTFLFYAANFSPIRCTFFFHATHFWPTLQISRSPMLATLLSTHIFSPSLAEFHSSLTKCLLSTRISLLGPYIAGELFSLLHHIFLNCANQIFSSWLRPYKKN